MLLTMEKHQEKMEISVYEILKDIEIREDRTLASDLILFLSYLLKQYKFLSYPCIRSRLPHKKNHLTHGQRLAISNFMVYAGISIPVAADFFSMCPDYDKAYSEYPPLVLLHGAVSDSREWRRQLDELSDEFTVMAWDAPGCGRSSDPPETFNLPDYADCLAAFIEEIGLVRPQVLGLSFGSGLALELYRSPHCYSKISYTGFGLCRMGGIPTSRCCRRTLASGASAI
jgi:hypothetical protein